MPNNFKHLPLMSKKNQFVYKGLTVIAWVIFVGLCVEAGALLVNFGMSLYNPKFIAHLYQKLDLSAMYARSEWAFYTMYSFILSIAILKALLFYVVIRLTYDFNLLKPFSDAVAKQITHISYVTLSIGLLSFIAREASNHLLHRGYEIDKLNQFWADSQAFILMAAIIYVISQIFKKGIELQNENDLTV